ncbi:hypothetical protein QFC21_000752 [Naganishia friedmannii]|uniref:Uncharacterized protein n=1 Tax=Naganishia friedmannii TaxID=89922 RepID=A0ACC2W6M9_9TREE|nr:hypothetical protein QFC21_000752 [Naganishia friedmannii]
MSAYAQPSHTSSSGSFSPLHFPLSSPPLHIPPSLQELEIPTSNGFRFGLVRRDRTRHSVDVSDYLGRKGMSRRDSTASVETLPEGTLSRPYDLAEDTKFMSTSTQRSTSSSLHGAYASGGARRPLTTANLLLRRSSSLLSLTSPEHDNHGQHHHRLPELSRTNSVSTCSSSGEGAVLRTPPHNLYEDFEVLSEEDEELAEEEDVHDVFFSSSSSKAQNSKLVSEESRKIVIHASPPPALLKRPGLPRRDTPIPPSHSSFAGTINKPSKSFTTSLTPVHAPVAFAVVQAAPSSTVGTTTEITGKPQRPVLKRRDTPRPVSRPVSRFTTFTPTLEPTVAGAVAEEEQSGMKQTIKVPNFFSTSLRRSPRAFSTEEALVQQDEDIESPVSYLTSSRSEESFTSYAYSPPLLPLSKYVVGLSHVAKGLRSVGKKERSFSSVVDGKVWVSV